MPVCGYVVVPRDGTKDDLARVLAETAGCEVVPAENASLLLLVTSTEGPREDGALRRRLEAMRDIQALLLTFGEVDPETKLRDPVADLTDGPPPRRPEAVTPLTRPRAKGAGSHDGS